MIDELVVNLLNGDGEPAILIEATVRRISKRSTGLDDKDIHKYLKRNIRKGDVLVVGPMRSGNPVALTAFYGVNRMLFGKDNSHVDMYTGRDKLVTADDRGVYSKGLGSTIGNRSHITVARPSKMNIKNRNKVAKYARSKIGKSFGLRNLIGAGLKALHPRLGLGPLTRARNAYTCSGLLAHSLNKGGVKVHSRKDDDFVAPADFRRSSNLRNVMSFDRNKKTNKWTITQRLRRARRKKKRKR